MKKWFRFSVLLLATALFAESAPAQEVSFEDPTGDDKGPGNYVYPTDKVYTAGSFDLTEFKMKVSGENVDFSTSVNANLDDPWGMGGGFSTQMVFIFIDTDGKEGSGFTKSLSGMNLVFAPADAWDKCIIFSPQPRNRVRNEVETKAGWARDAVVVPVKTRGAGRTISGTVALKDLGSGDPTRWGFQVVMQSNDVFPGKGDLLTRKVNELEGQHRFGGGNDGDCDPHAIDVLYGKGMGDESEIEAQYKMLAYACNPDGTSKEMATLCLVRK